MEPTMANSERYNDFYRELDVIGDTARPGCIPWSAPGDIEDWSPDPTAGSATIADDNLRIQLCPTCGSEGVLIFARNNDPDNERYEECPECEGGCLVLVEVEPIDLDDLPPPQGEPS
jgi:hypothetical protein